MMYWVYWTKTFTWRNKVLQANVVDPPAAEDGIKFDFGIRSPLQDHPYEVAPLYTFQIDSRPKKPIDNYSADVGFKLYSARLIELMKAFGVKFEHFSANVIDEKGEPLESPEYYVFHSLEGYIDAMDEEKSEWTGSWWDGVPRLVLDYDRFEHRPIFTCEGVLARLMRNDLQEAIEENEIRGFHFQKPEDHKTGKHVTWKDGIP